MAEANNRMSLAGNSVKRWAGALLIPLGVVVVAACSPTESNVESGNRDRILHIGNGSEPQTIDPHVISAANDLNIGAALFEGLVSLNPSTLVVEPGVAERWEFSDDQRVITFHLRKDARWSNGDPLTAHDFVWSLQRSLNPAMANQTAQYLLYLEGSQEYHTGVSGNPDGLGVEAIDDHTLQLTLTHPTPYFLQILAVYAAAYPVHRATVEAHGDAYARYTDWTRPENIVSNGAFVLEEWKLQKRLTVSKNPNYWDAQNVQLNGIVFHPIENETTEERMFRVGQLHVTDRVPLSKIPDYRRDNNPTYKQSPILGNWFLLLNTERPPLDDLRVRQALALAIDRELLVSTVLYGSTTPTASLTPGGVPGYSAPQPLRYDPERARQLLADAGYPAGEGWPGAEFMFNTNENNRKIMVALQQMWKEELDIEVSLTNLEWRVFLDNVDEHDYQGARMGWIGGYLDPTNFLDMFISDNPSNYTGFSNARYDEIMRLLAPRTSNTDKRFELLREAEAIPLEQAVVVPIFTYSNKQLVHESIKEFPTNLLRNYNFKHVRLGDPSKT